MANRIAMTVARRQKMYRFVSSVRASGSLRSAILSRSTRERRIQLSMPRRMISQASANRKEPMGPHCMRKKPYPNAEVAISRAKIQKIIMAVVALYRWLAIVPSASCNDPPSRRLRIGPCGQEQHHREAGHGNQIARTVGLREEPPDRWWEHDPVAEPAQAGVRPRQRVLGKRPLLTELRGTKVCRGQRHGHAPAVDQHDHEVHAYPHDDKPDTGQAVVVPGRPHQQHRQ